MISRDLANARRALILRAAALECVSGRQVESRLLSKGSSQAGSLHTQSKMDLCREAEAISWFANGRLALERSRLELSVPNFHLAGPGTGNPVS